MSTEITLRPASTSMENWQPTRAWQALRKVQNTKPMQRLALTLAFGGLFLAAAMVMAPWQQNIAAQGRVVAYLPTERPQRVESPVYGRVYRWGEGIVEGAVVKKGQFMLEIRDNDPNRSDRLADQVQSAKNKLEFAQQKIQFYDAQIEAYKEAREQVILAGESLVAEAQRKVEAENQGVLEAKAALAQTTSNLQRQNKLHDRGFVATVSLEKDRRSQQEAEAKVGKAEKYVQAAEEYLAAKQAELQQKSQEGLTKIDYARALRQEALGDVSLAEKELADALIKQSQFASRVIEAPKDGFIFRLFVAENAEMLKEGDPLFEIVPATAQRAVELLVKGNDAPLISIGKPVRLQFEGWPAVQFAAGWPEIAAGTFGGVVAAVDAADNGKGSFRILVRPGEGDAWPDEKFLRQGGRANGWVLLKTVPLGYEIWRQFNGFPPVYSDGKEKDPAKEASKSAKQVLGK